mgnify:CR=1 FL=1
MKINKEWHLSHLMPKNPTFEQRVEWHTEHLKNCQCRDGIPEKLKEEMIKRNMKLPTSIKK